MGKKYTELEMKALQEYYPIGDWDSLFKVFPNKTKNTIRYMATKYKIKSNNSRHIVDITGKRFGKLTVLYRIEGKAPIYWHCLCNCGNFVDVMGQHLKNGTTKSCGCITPMINKVGNRYGKLVVKKMLPKYKGDKVYCLCDCDCGNEAIIPSDRLNYNKKNCTKSCGCLKKRSKPQVDIFGNELNQISDYRKNKFIVYKHTSPCGKSYIGITSMSFERRFAGGKGYKDQTKFWNAIQKYGWDNFSHEVLEKDLKYYDACIKEKEYIKKFDSIKNGYNITIGGDGIRSKGKKVYQIKDGVIVNTFNSAGEASEVIGNITMRSIINWCIDGENGKEINGYIWKRDLIETPFEYTEYNNMELLFDPHKRQEEYFFELGKRAKKVKINQYDLQGRYLKTWDSIKDAALVYGTSIGRALKENMTAYGYQWRRYNNNTDNINSTINYDKKAVQQIDPRTKEIIATYPSMMDAKRSTGINNSHIADVCKGIRITAGNYIWKFV